MAVRFGLCALELRQACMELSRGHITLEEWRRRRNRSVGAVAFDVGAACVGGAIAVAVAGCVAVAPIGIGIAIGFAAAASARLIYKHRKLLFRLACVAAAKGGVPVDSYACTRLLLRIATSLCYR